MRRGDHNAVIHQPSRPFDGARSVDRGLHGGDLAGEGNERFPAKPAPEAHLHLAPPLPMMVPLWLAFSQ